MQWWWLCLQVRSLRMVDFPLLIRSGNPSLFKMDGWHKRLNCVMTTKEENLRSCNNCPKLDNSTIAWPLGTLTQEKIHASFPGIRPGVAQMPNFLLPYNLQRQGQQGQRMSGRRGGAQQQLQQQHQQQHQQQLLQRNANQGFRYMHNARNGPDHSLMPQGLMGAMMPMPLDVAGVPVGNAETARPQPMPITALASSLASASPEQQRAMLGEQLFPLVDQLEHDHAGKVTGMLLEMDQTEVLHLIESPDALKAKVLEAMEVLRLAQAAAVVDPADQLASLSLNESLGS
eukprot:Gb_00732 [translate_table: standard]